MIKNSVLSFCMLLSFAINAQNYCEVANSFLSPTFPETVDTFTVLVDTVTNFYGDEFKVKLKFSRPVNDNLPFVKRPLIISLHGGGFVSDSLGQPFSTQGYLDAAEQMRTTVAPLGFIGASLDYRTGYGVIEEISVAANISNPGAGQCSLLTPHVMEAVAGAVYRATTDCRSAIDYIFRHSEDFPFIDTSQIYLFGASAGAITALHSNFSETNEFYPVVDSIVEPLAPMHRLAGIIVYAGALADNNNGLALNHMDADESVPLFLGHGTADQVVLPGSGPICNCNNLPQDLYMHGSISIADRACELEIPHELFLIQDEVHGLNGEAPVSSSFVLAIFQFLKNWGICPGNLNSVHNTYDQQGVLLNSEGCLLISTADFDAEKLIVYPNPASTIISIRNPDNCQVESADISDIWGRRVLTTNFSASVDISELPSGLYFIRTVTDKGITNSSFIKAD